MESLIRMNLVEVINSPLPSSIGISLFSLYVLYFFLVINFPKKSKSRALKDRLDINSLLIFAGFWLALNMDTWQIRNIFVITNICLFLLVFVYLEIRTVEDKKYLFHHVRTLWFLLLSTVYFKLWVSIVIISFCVLLIRVYSRIINPKLSDNDN